MITKNLGKKRQNSWQLAKHAQLYPEVPKAFKVRTCDSSGLMAERTLISASAVNRYGMASSDFVV